MGRLAESGIISRCPALRYYFHTRLYVQAEAQLNAPQYTKTLLAGQDHSSSITGADTTKSVFLKKLFYFNLPLSVHYSLLKNLYVGAGAQYSRLTNGVALIQEEKPGGQNLAILPRNDTFYIESKVVSFKSDPVYHQLKNQEFRFLFDLNYQWKPLTLGARYNRSFTNFIHAQVTGTVITEAHNSSLQVYLRYTLLDLRKKQVKGK